MDCQAAISNLNPEAGLGQVGKEGHVPKADRNGSGINQGSRTGTCVSLGEEAQRLMDEKGSAQLESEGP